MSKTAEERFNTANISYNYCGVCGHIPKRNEEPNRAPLRWWDCDDGWKIGTLCRPCVEHELVLEARPKPADYAFSTTNAIADMVDTDEDPTEAI